MQPVQTDLNPSPASRRLRPRVLRAPFGYVMLVVVGVLVAAPLFFLVYGSFSSEAIPSTFTFQHLTVNNYLQVYRNHALYGVLWNTVVYMVGSSLFGIAISAGMAYLIERTDLPAKGLFYSLVLTGFGMPGMLQAIAWELLLSRGSGIFTHILTAVAGPQPWLDINTMGGMIFVQGLHTAPIGFLMFIPMLRSMDPSLEEAATVLGASRIRRHSTVTLRLLMPGLIAIIIYQMISTLEIFEIPGILGLPGHVYVFSTLLYTMVHTSGSLPAYNIANALGMSMLALAAIGLWWYYRMLRTASRFSVLTGKGFQPRPSRLGRWRGVFVGLAVAYCLAATVIPFLVLLYTSLLPFLEPPTMAALHHLSWSNYRFLNVGIPVTEVLTHTFLMSFTAATGTILVAFATSYIVIRTKFRWRGLLDALAFIPHGIPGIVTGLAFFWIFIRFDAIFGTVWTIAIAFIMQFIAYGTRMMNATLVQIHPELEEAGRVLGAPRLRIIGNIIGPLVTPAAIGLWLWVFLLALRVAALPLMLYSGKKGLVLSVLIWNLWNGGEVPSAAALGTLLMAVVFVLVMSARRFGFQQSLD